MRLNGMILTDKQIKNSNEISIEPMKEFQVQPASVDLRLAGEYSKDGKTIETDTIKIKPKEFVLTRTKEYIEISDKIAAYIEGRSSIGRKGLFIENAGWIDPGFKGTITLELFNASNDLLEIPKDIRICQIIFEELKQSVDTGYGDKNDSKYQGQVETTESRLETDIISKKYVWNKLSDASK